MHRGKAEALKILAELSKVSSDVLLSFDRTTPIRDAARLQSCIALDQQGDSTATVQGLRALANDAGVFPAIRETSRTMLEAVKVR